MTGAAQVRGGPVTAELTAKLTANMATAADTKMRIGGFRGRLEP